VLIFQKNKKNKPRIAHKGDRQLYIIIGFILVLGLISLSSASSVMAYSKYGDAYFYFKHQLFGLGLGLVAFIALSRINYHIWRKNALWYFIFSIVLLTLVFIPGLSAEYGTARSWINILGFSLQPSEFVKLTFLLYLAAWLEARKNDLYDLHLGIGPFIVTLGVIAVLMLKQPDIGTLVIIGVTALITYFVGGGSKKHIVFIILFSLVSLSIMVQLQPYQMDRFKCMLNSEYSLNDKCYQSHQSLIAVGSGGFFGRGLGESRQKFMYLPEVFGDFIFAVVAEEAGWIVSTFFVLCFLFLFYKGYSIARNTADDFGRNLAIGIVSWIVIQALINIGGIINIIPMTGVPLPMVSYGGSAILATLAALGILVNISKYTK
jgi:cell division protein FtsW